MTRQRKVFDRVCCYICSILSFSFAAFRFGRVLVLVTILLSFFDVFIAYTDVAAATTSPPPSSPNTFRGSSWGINLKVEAIATVPNGATVSH